MSGINDCINEESILFPINLDPFSTNLRSSEKIEDNTEEIENSDEEDHLWKRLATILLNETQENYMEKLDKFYAHLLTLKNKNQSDRSSKLLNNIPSLEITQAHSIYNNNSSSEKVIEENLQNDDGCPSQISKFLLRFLRGGNHNIESATKLLLDYLQMMKDHPNYYDGLTNSGKVQAVYNENFMTSLNHRDKFGRRVCITRPGYWNPDKIKFCDLFCAVFKLYSMISEEEKTQIAGCTAIIDAKNFGFKQLRNISFEDIRVVVNFIQDVFPIWFRQIHIINAPRAFNILFGMMKPLFNERVRAIILFQDSLESLHEYVDKDILPEELDGTNGNFCNNEAVLAVKEMNEYFIQLKEYADYVNN